MSASTSSTVRKAVIPVAGLGTRHFPASHAVKKELFPVVGPDGIALEAGDGTARRMDQPGAFAFEAPGFFFDLQDSVSAVCGETLIALVVAGLNGKTLQLLVGISDPAAITALAERNRQLLPGAVGTPQQQGAPPADLKL